MAEKRYYWLKLYDDFFTSKRIKKLRSIAGGDTYTIIYLKMQLKALKSEGYLYFDGVMNDFAEELALDLDEKVDDVKITINYLSSVGLLESNAEGAEYKLTYMENVTGSESASTQRSRQLRMRRKEKMLQCNADATQLQQMRNVEIEKDIEIEKEKIKSIGNKSKRFVPPTLDEVITYVKERGNKIDPNKFYDYYTAADWKDSKGQQVRNWKQKCITWENHRSEPAQKLPDFENKTAQTKKEPQMTPEEAKEWYDNLIQELTNGK